VENGYTVPAVETLEKFARALEVPMYRLFYDGEQPPKLPHLPSARVATTSFGAVRAKRRDCLLISAACSTAWKKVTWNGAVHGPEDGEAEGCLTGRSV